MFFVPGPHTITRMQSNLPGVENGTSGLSVVSVAQTTKLNGEILLKIFCICCCSFSPFSSYNLIGKPNIL